MARESNGWGPSSQPSEGDTRLATGLSMVSLPQGAPPALPGLNGEQCSWASTGPEPEVQPSSALLWPGQTDRHFQGSLELLLHGTYVISLLEMNPRPGQTQAPSTGDTFDGRGEGCGVPGTGQILIH